MAHIGVIHGLLEKGFTIGSVAGTSIGSVVGAVFISGNLDEFSQWVERTGKLDVWRRMDFAMTKNGLIKGEKAPLNLGVAQLWLRIRCLRRPCRGPNF